MRRYGGMSGHRYGDLFMNLAAWRALKRLDPAAHVSFFINGNYRDAAPLFLDQPDIDHIHITHSPVGDLDEEDVVWCRKQGFYGLFSMMPDHNHSDPWWRTGRNQPQEVCFMHGLPIIDDGKLVLNRWFEPMKGLEKYVALQAFAGSYDPTNKKQLTADRAQDIVCLIRERGYQVLQLGTDNEPQLKDTLRLSTDYFGAIKNLLGCRALVTTDSGFVWASSCYDHPTLGLYSHAYYGKDCVRAIQPINRNAIYLDEANVNDISLSSIGSALDKLL